MYELSKDQKQRLLNNSNVEKVTKNHVVYTSSFKIKAVELYLEGKSPDAIFAEAKIPIHYFKDRYCGSCLKRWKKKYLNSGVEGLMSDSRGSGEHQGRPKKPTYEELEAIVAIQREALGYAKK